jgi:hypothetical protein
MAIKIPIWIVTPLDFMIILALGNYEYTHNSILMELGGIALVIIYNLWNDSSIMLNFNLYKYLNFEEWFKVSMILLVSYANEFQFTQVFQVM